MADLARPQFTGDVIKSVKNDHTTHETINLGREGLSILIYVWGSFLQIYPSQPTIKFHLFINTSNVSLLKSLFIFYGTLY